MGVAVALAQGAHVRTARCLRGLPGGSAISDRTVARLVATVLCTLPGVMRNTLLLSPTYRFCRPTPTPPRRIAAHTHTKARRWDAEGESGCMSGVHATCTIATAHMSQRTCCGSMVRLLHPPLEPVMVYHEYNVPARHRAAHTATTHM